LTVADFYTERRFIEITTAMSNINEQIEQEENRLAPFVIPRARHQVNAAWDAVEELQQKHRTSGKTSGRIP